MALALDSLVRLPVAARVYHPHDGHGAADALVLADSRGGTTYSEKWGGESWFALQRKAGRGELLRWFVRPDGRLEHELVLLRKANAHVFAWRFDHSPGLSIDYQHPTRYRGRRPVDVRGSYALYHYRTNNQYKTGKLAHIYRPLISDAAGRRAWGQLRIRGGELTVTVPPEWLARATYPVVVDPTIGYTSIGASTDTTEDYALAVTHQAAEAGEANPGTAYYGGFSASGTLTVYIGAYVHSASGPWGQARLAASSGISLTTGTGEFRSAAITWTGIAASTNYIVTTWSDSLNNRVYYDSGGATGWYQKTNAASPGNPFPSSTPNSGTFNNRASAYVDFTGGGGGATSMPLGPGADCVPGFLALVGLAKWEGKPFSLM